MQLRLDEGVTDIHHRRLWQKAVPANSLIPTSALRGKLVQNERRSQQGGHERLVDSALQFGCHASKVYVRPPTRHLWSPEASDAVSGAEHRLEPRGALSTEGVGRSLKP